MKSKRPWVLALPLCWAVLLAFGSLCLVPSEAGASFVESRFSDGAPLSERAAQIESIRHALQTDVVAERLKDLGLSPQQVEAKLSGFSDEQIQSLAGLSGDLAGGGFLETVVGVLLIALLVVLILKLLDKEIIIR